MTIRKVLLGAAVAAVAFASACREQETGPVVVSAIGGPAEIVNPNLEQLDRPSALLVGLAAQGLVRFDAAGQIEPALAQSWIVSDDGLRYTFRIARTEWTNGKPVTAEQVAARLRAAIGRGSENPLKPLLGAITEIEAMTENVLEISLAAPRPNLLQLLAQPELGIIRNGETTGPYRAASQPDGSVLLTLPEDEDDLGEDEEQAGIVLRGEPAAVAVARFNRGLSDLVAGGTVGDLPIARAANPPAAALRFDPVAGLFGLAFADDGGALVDPAVRRALSMAIDRPAIVAALGLPDLQAREALIPTGIDELTSPSVPDWAANPLPMRRELAARTIGGIEGDAPLTLRVAVPEGPGYKLVFAHLKRDWRMIGVSAEAVAPEEQADVRLIDAVAPANVATWYLRRFSCGESPICSPEADAMLEAARTTQDMAERRELLANADRVLAEATPFIPLTAPVRWSLVSPRLTGFQTNMFGRRFLGGLVAERR